MELISKKIEGPIVYLGMNRPEKRNSLSPELIRQMILELNEINMNPDIRVIILYGEGKIFSAGGDIETFNSLEDTTSLLNYMKIASEITETISRLDKIVISAVHGFASGAGFSLALASDFIVATTDAKFVCSFTKVGLIPDLGLMKNLVKKVSTPVAKEWIISGKAITAEEAFTHGVISKIANNNLLEDAANFAQFIVESPPLANQFVKFMINHGDECSPAISQLQENLIQSLLLQTYDSKEGIKAFFEKRKPSFTGK